MKESNRFEPYCTTDSVILILRHATLSCPQSRRRCTSTSTSGLFPLPNFDFEFFTPEQQDWLSDQLTL